MASLGHTSMHSRHSVHRSAMTIGRSGPGSRARVGQVGKQAPQAVHRSLIETAEARNPITSGTRVA